MTSSVCAVVHVCARREHLPQIFVLGDHEDFKILGRKGAGHRRDEVVRLEPRLDEDRNPRVADDLDDPLFLRLKLRRRRDAIGFVFRINLPAKDRLIAAVDHHAEIIGLALLDQVQQHLREDIGRLGRLAGGAGQIAKRREERAKNLGVAVDDVEGFALGHCWR